MDMMQARIVVRERPLLDVVDLTLRFMSAHKLAYGKTMLIVILPSIALSWAFAAFAGWAWGWAFALLLSLTAQAPFTMLAGRLVFMPVVRVREVLLSTLRVMPHSIGAKVLQCLALFTASVFFLLPVAWVGTITLFLLEVIVLEQGTLTRSFSRSYRIVSSDTGELFLVWLGLVATPAAMAFIGDIAGRAILADFLQITPPQPIWETGGNALALIGFWLSIPAIATARFLFYLNVRTRSEGWDIQTRFAALTLPPQAESLG